VEITSRLLTESGRRLHLGLPEGLEPGGYELELRGLRAFNGSPLEVQVLVWQQEPPELPVPALLRAEVLPGYRFRLELSDDLGTDLRDEQGRFRQDLIRSEPPLPGLSPVDQDGQTVLFQAEACAALELNGPPFLLIAEGLVDRLGRPFEGANARLEVRAPRSWIPELRVFPNPWRAGEGGAEGSGALRFSGLTDGATVRIYDLSGRLQQRLENRPWSAGDLDWDPHGPPGSAPAQRDLHL
jgi:hypothetical protein